MSHAHDRLAGLALAIALVALDVRMAEAALPPYWQSAREIETILGDQRVHDAFKYEEPILSISTTGNQVYEIKTPRCALDVKVVYQPTNIAGPAGFTIEIGQAVCQ